MAALEPVDPSFYDSAAWKIDVVRDVALARQDAWRIIADNASWPSWFPGIAVCETIGEPASGLGSKRHVKGRGLDVTERFIVWEPGAAWGFTILSMKRSFASRMAERVSLADAGDGRTRITYLMAIEPKPWARWMRPLLTAGAQRVLGKALQNLEQHAVR